MAATTLALQDDEIRFGRVLHPGAEGLGYTKQEYVWLGGARLANSSQLTKILDTWGLEKPNLLINLVTSWCHPRAFLHSHSLTQPDLKDVVKKAREAVQLQKKAFEEAMKLPQDKLGSKAGGTNGAQAGDEEELLVLEMLSESLFNKLVSVMVALIDACARTNSWLLCDNYTSIGTLMYILEVALARTQSRPIILCVADSKAEMWNEGPETVSGHLTTDSWAQLKETAVWMKDEESLETLVTTRLPSELFPGTSLDTLWPRPAIDGNYSKQDAGDHKLNKWPFRGASHYMFLETGPTISSKTDRGRFGTASGWALPFPTGWLGPMGYIVTGGSTGYDAAADKIIFNAVISGEPTIILKNTGVASDFFAHVIDSVLHDQQLNDQGDSQPLNDEDAVIKKLNERYPFWYSKEDQESLYGGERLHKNMYPFVSGILSVPRMQLRDSTVIIDAFSVSPETVLRRLSSCFASSSDGAFEVGAGGASKEVVEKVWNQHAILEYNAVVFGNIANRMTLSGFLFSFLSTVLAVLVTYVKGNEDHPWAEAFAEHSDCTRVGVMAFPALAGLFVTLLSRLRYVSKWGTVYMATQQTESEIYKYRVQAVEYDVRPKPSPVAVAKNTRKKAGQKSVELQETQVRSKGEIRKCFVERTSAIFRSVMTSEVQEDALADPGDPQALMKKKLASTKRRSAGACCGFFAPRGEVPRATRQSDAGADTYLNISDDEPIDADDLIGSLSAEQYFEHRVLPKLVHYRALAPRLSRRLTHYEVLIVITSLASTLLGAFQYTNWIPVAVSFGAILSSLLTYEALHQRVSAVNAAVQDLMDVQVRWSSYGVVEKRTASVKAFLVEVTETAIMREAAAYTVGAASAGSRRTTDEGKDKADNEGEGKGGDANGKTE